MKAIAELPPGDWSLIVFAGDVIAVCPEHPPRVIDADGSVHELRADRVLVLREIE